MRPPPDVQAEPALLPTGLQQAANISGRGQGEAGGNAACCKSQAGGCAARPFPSLFASSLLAPASFFPTLKSDQKALLSSVTISHISPTMSLPPAPATPSPFSAPCGPPLPPLAPSPRLLPHPLLLPRILLSPSNRRLPPSTASPIFRTLDGLPIIPSPQIRDS